MYKHTAQCVGAWTLRATSLGRMILLCFCRLEDCLLLVRSRRLECVQQIGSSMVSDVFRAIKFSSSYVTLMPVLFSTGKKVKKLKAYRHFAPKGCLDPTTPQCKSREHQLVLIQ